MPEKQTLQRAARDKRAGKSASTQAGEFVREQIEHIREGRHGARSTKQAIAIGLSEARRAGVDLPPPRAGKTSDKTRKSAKRAYAAGQSSARHAVSQTRSRATTAALKREPRSTASRAALAAQTRQAAARRSPAERSAAGRRAAQTKGAAGRSSAARKAARTRAARAH